ncbi:hypothetical protein [Flagellimonas sp.]|uniref:hypothetical protein n=1 Tax=Flagellimonas sp. TaxID=2058762 RepID=UPI003BABDD7F
MEELKLHSFGQHDHLESLKKKYEPLKNNLERDIELDETEKKSKLKALKQSFDREKRDSKNNLY